MVTLWAYWGNPARSIFQLFRKFSNKKLLEYFLREFHKNSLKVFFHKILEFIFEYFLNTFIELFRGLSLSIIVSKTQEKKLKIWEKNLKRFPTRISGVCNIYLGEICMRKVRIPLQIFQKISKFYAVLSLQMLLEFLKWYVRKPKKIFVYFHKKTF